METKGQEDIKDELLGSKVNIATHKENVEQSINIVDILQNKEGHKYLSSNPSIAEESNVKEVIDAIYGLDFIRLKDFDSQTGLNRKALHTYILLVRNVGKLDNLDTETKIRLIELEFRADAYVYNNMSFTILPFPIKKNFIQEIQQGNDEILCARIYACTFVLPRPNDHKYRRCLDYTKNTGAAMKVVKSAVNSIFGNEIYPSDRFIDPYVNKYIQKSLKTKLGIRMDARRSQGLREEYEILYLEGKKWSSDNKETIKSWDNEKKELFEHIFRIKLDK